MALIPAGGGTMRGTYASRPTVALEGTTYYCTDSPIYFIYTGGAWTQQGPTFALTAPPAVSAFTQRNAGGRTTTWSDYRGGILGTLSDGTSAEDLRTLCKSAPAAPYTITVHMLPLLGAAQYPLMGLCWRNSTSGNVEIFGLFGSSVTNVLYMNHRKVTASNNGTSPTYTLSTTGDALADHMGLGAGVWLQISDDNTNRIMRYSVDGQNYRTYTAVTRTTFMTPDEVGIYIGNGPGSNTLATCLFTSWVQS